MRERLLPNQEVLAQRLFRQSQELAELRRHRKAPYHALVLELRDAGWRNRRPRPMTKACSGWRARRRRAWRAVPGHRAVDTLDVMDDMLKVMSAQVTVRPSGHQFIVKATTRCCQAGLRAGLKLNYGCGNGSAACARCA